MTKASSLTQRVEKRLQRERRTIRLMIGIYCRAQHGKGGESLCAECQQLNDYAMQRIDRCRFQNDKPTCAKCPVHCYNSTMREQVRKVMRYAGPRMLLYHPILAIMHVIDERKARDLSKMALR